MRKLLGPQSRHPVLVDFSPTMAFLPSSSFLSGSPLSHSLCSLTSFLSFSYLPAPLRPPNRCPYARQPLPAALSDDATRADSVSAARGRRGVCRLGGRGWLRGDGCCVHRPATTWEINQRPAGQVCQNVQDVALSFLRGLSWDKMSKEHERVYPPRGERSGLPSDSLLQARSACTEKPQTKRQMPREPPG